ncbi:MAG: 5-bromo-4-chloroindolyl phosphate hydrolysis family protein [Clostridia bacterium]|nr:5-bromo-4-chloroindolyl phosphate hydrolysis family protein [Clostridia bacterium]
MANKPKKGTIPFWLIVLGFVFGFWPGVILLGISMLQNRDEAAPKTQSQRTYDAQSQRAYNARGQRTYRAPGTGRREGETTEEYHSRLSRESDGAEETAKQPNMRYGMNADGTYRYSYTAPKIEVRRPAARSRKEAVKEQYGMLQDQRLNPKIGKSLRLAGNILLGFGMFATAVTFLGMLAGYNPFFDIAMATSITALTLCTPGAVMRVVGSRKQNRVMRCRTYATIIGNRRWVEIEELADAIPVRYGKCVKDLRWMLAEGLLHGMYIDGTDKILTYPEAEAAPKTADTRQAPDARTDDGDFPEARRIRTLNDTITDSYVSQRMDRLEELTRKILTYVGEHPEKESSIRQFRNHYLPKTVSILESYARMERTGVEGGNISAAMKDVEDIMDKLVLGFEKQLDALFDSEAMDVTTDVSVLENMMTMEGLSDLDPFGAGARAARREEVK